MQYEIEVGGRRRQVIVARSGGGFAVTVDGTTRQVDVARIGGHTLSLIVDKVWSVEASVTAGRDDHATVHVRGTAVAVALNGRRRFGAKGDRHQASGSGPQRLTAPMPGKIVRVPVSAGDHV